MNILVSGASGFIGGEVVRHLETRGERVYRLTRSPARPKDLFWNVEKGVLDLSGVGQIDAVVHLAGENIGSGPWTRKRRRRILESREGGTRLLCDRLSVMKRPPEVLVCASGISYYSGNDGVVHQETDPPGESFLSDVCVKWEAATSLAREAKIRVVNLRLGIVLGRAGGALRKMLPAFRTGLGGPIGDGRQSVCWIALDDVIGVIDRCLSDKSVEGPVNTVAPEPVTNRVFSMTLAKALNRPCFVTVPSSLIRFLFGEMGRETLLSDVSAIPNVLFQKGYQFQYPNLSDALSGILGKGRRGRSEQ